MKTADQLLISLAGAGGKTSIHAQLISDAKYSSAYDRRSIIGTTTTQMFYPSDKDLYDRISVLTADQGIPDGISFLYSSLDASQNKVRGLSPQQASRLKRDGADLIICEADGARRRSLKAPNDEEPLHPGLADIIIGVIGLSTYGKPFTDENVHRLPFLSRITDTDRIIDEHSYIDLIQDDRGLFKHSPDHAKRIVVLNQADLLSREHLKDIYQAVMGAHLQVDALFITEMKPSYVLYHTYRSET